LAIERLNLNIDVVINAVAHEDLIAEDWTATKIKRWLPANLNRGWA
jgi:hypothetical protein